MKRKSLWLLHIVTSAYKDRPASHLLTEHHVFTSRKLAAAEAMAHMVTRCGGRDQAMAAREDGSLRQGSVLIHAANGDWLRYKLQHVTDPYTIRAWEPKHTRWFYKFKDQTSIYANDIEMTPPATKDEVIEHLRERYPDAPVNVWPAAGELTEDGCLRWCSKCGQRAVAKNHAETRCYPCQSEEDHVES